MSVIGLSFTKMEASRTNNPVKGEIKINSTPKITDVKEIEVASLKDKALSLEFEFVTEYAPDVGKIVVSGNVMFMGNNNKKVLEEWDKDKKIPEEESVQVLNHIFRKCLIKVAMLADDLQLPPPMNIPMVKKAEK